MMADVSGLGLAWVFIAGIVSFLSPCVLPIVPAYVSYVAGRSLEELREPRASTARTAALVSSAGFVLGFSLVFIALGAGATALGELLRSYRSEMDLIAGALIILFGLHLAGILHVRPLQGDWRFLSSKAPSGPLGAIVIGAAFAFGWTPCIGPILGSILSLGAARATVGEGILMLSIYSMGLGVPFLLVAAFTGAFVQRIKAIGQFGKHLQILSGAILVAVGLAMAAGVLGSFGTWLLTTFPVLGRLAI